MKKMLLVLLLGLFSMGCASTQALSGKVGISEPNSLYSLLKGFTKEEVKVLLGNPHHTSSRQTTEVWYYYPDPDNDKQMFVYFVEGKVIETGHRQ